MYVQYGCGLHAPAGWRNFDASLRLRLENFPVSGSLLAKRRLFPRNAEYGDICKGLPVSDNSAEGVYCSHVLEHIPRSKIALALRNTRRILKPGGIFRLVVPDLGWCVQEYVANQGDAGAADDFQKKLMLRNADSPSGSVGRLRAVVGLSAHQWMYDQPAMESLLAEAGFTEIRRCEFGDCEDEMFSQVEDHGRFVDEGHKELALECRRAA